MDEWMNVDSARGDLAGFEIQQSASHAAIASIFWVRIGDDELAAALAM